jgi:hypothetical protein
VGAAARRSHASIDVRRLGGTIGKGAGVRDRDTNARIQELTGLSLAGYGYPLPA